MNMLEIGLSRVNELYKYEEHMNRLRAVALWVTEHGEEPIQGLGDPRSYIFSLLKIYSRLFAEDIVRKGSIAESSIGLFQASLDLADQFLAIDEEYVMRASNLQRYANCGFWGPMSRVIGQLPDVAEEAIKKGVTQVVTAAVSGCVIGEGIGLHMAEKYNYDIPIDHMILVREGPNPIAGMMRPGFVVKGDHVLFADDAVMDMMTLGVVETTLKSLNPGIKISLMAIDVHPMAEISGYLKQFERFGFVE